MSVLESDNYESSVFQSTLLKHILYVQEGFRTF